MWFVLGSVSFLICFFPLSPSPFYLVLGKNSLIGLDGNVSPFLIGLLCEE